MARAGVSKPVRRSSRQRKQFIPELHYDATAYMKAPKVAAAEPKGLAPSATRESSSSLAAWISAVASVFSSLKVKLVPSWRRQPVRRRSKAAKKSPTGKAAAAKRSSRLAKKASL